METFFQKYGWAINLALIALGALLLALMVNGFIASRLAPFTVPEMPSFAGAEDGAGRAQREVNRVDWSGELGRRCLFGCAEPIDPSVCPGGCPEGKQCQNGTCVDIVVDEPEFVSDVPVQSDLNLKLTGAMVAREPRWSLALILDNATQQTLVSSIGDMLPGNAELIEIRRDRILVNRSGRIEFIRLENTIGGNPTPTAARPQARRPTEGDAVVAESMARGSQLQQAQQKQDSHLGVRQDGENRYAVERAAIERELADPAALARQARIMTNYRDGEAHGLRLVGVTPNSVFSQLGIRSGDVIHSINGTTLNNQRQAMDLLDSMRRENRVVIEVERRGSRQKYEYNIR
jgi:general secretion pathway protein C